MRETTWDEGVIAEFMRLPTTVGTAVELAGGHTLLLFSDLSISAIQTAARDLEAMLEWMGTPRPFRVVLWWRTDPRRLSATEWPSRRTVNGGWTVSGSSTICIYRAEEWDRVVLHEMIHALEWDWQMPTTPAPCWGVPAGQYSPALFEAWTEVLAEWFWCGWNAKPTDTTGELWKRQRAWQEFQATQILARHSAQSPQQRWKENTSVFAYYILKTILAPYIAVLWFSQRENKDWLCELVNTGLRRLEAAAKHTKPKSMSLRMTDPL